MTKKSGTDNIRTESKKVTKKVGGVDLDLMKRLKKNQIKSQMIRLKH
jgi:hypothetical protein